MLTSFFKKRGFIIVNLLILYVVVCVLAGCAMYTDVDGPISSIPSGSKVQFQKITNTSFARQYIGADIITDVEFLSSSFSMRMKGDVPEGYFGFYVVASGETSKPSSGLSSTAGGTVIAPIKYADLVFSLKPGDLIELRGGTVVRKTSGFVKFATWGMTGDLPYVIFKATDLKRVDGK